MAVPHPAAVTNVSQESVRQGGNPVFCLHRKTTQKASATEEEHGQVQRGLCIRAGDGHGWNMTQAEEGEHANEQPKKKQ
jgi:hypothetical protein